MDKEEKIINPKECMPEPDQHFWILIKESKNKDVSLPAILIDYTEPDCFHFSCLIFNKNGSTYSLRRDEKNRLIGWKPMFPNTKVYKIVKSELNV